jgi:hypothetical protein
MPTAALRVSNSSLTTIPIYLGLNLPEKMKQIQWVSWFDKRCPNWREFATRANRVSSYMFRKSQTYLVLNCKSKGNYKGTFFFDVIPPLIPLNPPSKGERFVPIPIGANQGDVLPQKQFQGIFIITLIYAIKY